MPDAPRTEDGATPPAAPPSGLFGKAQAWWRRQSQRLKDHFAEYGWIAIAMYFVIFFLTWAGFAIAISSGLESDGSATDAGTIGAAWVATKTTQPLRIIATLAITPFVADLWFKIRPRKPAPTTKESE